MNKKILVFGILIILVAQMGFVLGGSEDVIFSLENIDIIGPSDAIESWSEGDVYHILIREGLEGSNKLTIGDQVFENILSQSEAGHPTIIELNSKGEILKADFTVNEKGGTYFINENEFEVPANSENPRIIYTKESKSLELPKGSKLNEMSDEELFVKGFDLNLLDEVLLNGEGSAVINKEGYLIKKGKAIYEGLEINIDDKSGDVLIVKYGSSDYQGNRIEKHSDNLFKTLLMNSSETGSINVKFLKNNDLFEMGEYGKLNMKLEKGDDIQIDRLWDASSKISHKSSGTGTTSIQNNGLNFAFKEGDLAFRPSQINVDEILSKEYAGVECVVDSNLEKMISKELEIDENGQASLGKFVKTYNVNTPELTKETISSYSGSLGKFASNGFEHEDFLKVAESLTKENSIKVADDLFNNRLPDVIEKASQNGFNKDQTVNLITKTVDLAGKDSGTAFLYMNRPLGFADGRMTPNEFTTFSLEVTKEALEEGNLDLLNPAYALLDESLDQELDLTNTLDFTSRAIHLKGDIDIKNQEVFLRDGLDEYDGNNFESITQGIRIADKYTVSENFINGFDLDLKYSELKNKNDLAKQYISIVNEYYEGNVDPYKSLTLGRQINEFHDAEGELKEGDSIRNSIIGGLSSKSKYHLVAHARDDKDLYPTTFGKLVDSFPEGFLDEIEEIDPNKEYKLPFTLQLASRGVLDKVVERDSLFFRETIEEALSVKDEKELMKNSAFVSKTLVKYYEDPKKYGKEKEYFENLLVDMYEEKGLTLKEESTIAYLMKLNENPGERLKEKLNKLKLPNIDSIEVNENYINRDIQRARLFFVDDEESFEQSEVEFQGSKYGMKFLRREKTEDKEIVFLEKTYENGKKMIIEMVLIPRRGNAQDDFSASLNDCRYSLLAIRAHCYNHNKIMDPAEESNSDKIIHFGECGGASKVPDHQANIPKANFISWTWTGTRFENNKIVYNALEGLIEEETDFDKLIPAKDTLINPNDPSQGIWKYYNQYKEYKEA